MALGFRQKRWYNSIVTIHRPTRNTAGDYSGYTTVATGVQCGCVNTANYDQSHQIVGKVKQNNIDTSDQVKFELSQDIQAEDVLEFTGGENEGEWKKVVGEPRPRPWRANDQLVFTNPIKKPAAIP